jgi:hypothetical protein
VTANGTSPLGEVEYADLVSRVRASIAGAIPPSASVLVISKGDPALLAMSGIAASHFPQDGAGGTARWWLDHYEAFARHLATHCDLIADDPASCLIYRLGKGGRDAAVLSSAAEPGVSIEQMRDFLKNLIEPDAELAVLEASGGVASALAPLHAVSVHGDLAQLRLLAAGGAEYLVVPTAEKDLLDRDAELNASIEASCRKIADQRHLCRVFALEGLREAG